MVNRLNSHASACLAGALAALLIACGGDPPAGSTDVDVGAGDAIGGDGGVPDIGVPDIGPADTGAPTDVPTIPDDLGVDSADIPEDTGGEPGDTCETDDDCIGGLLCADLVAGEGGGVCSEPCEQDDDCPRGLDCVFIAASGNDAVSVCVDPDLCIDEDDDGFGFGPGCQGRDCDDTNENINPRASELCNGIDDDCDENIDDSPTDIGQPCSSSFSGACEAGTTICMGGSRECAPLNAPRDEECNGIDDDCDGMVDEDDAGAPLARSCFGADVALIGIGVCTGGTQVCQAGAFGTCAGQVLPGPEQCNDLDDNCDGEVDNDIQFRNYWPDADNDGFGDPLSEAVADCVLNDGFADNDDDCNDGDDTINPDAREIRGDGIDQNCDGAEICYADNDEDGFHDGTEVFSPSGVCTGRRLLGDDAPDGDCDDFNTAINPDATEIPGDSVDQNCDGAEICFADVDGDMATDGTEIVSDDTDCDDEGELDADGDTGDCDDLLMSVGPGFMELCDSLDNDCNDRIDDGANCLGVDEPCLDGTDCMTDYCEAGLCAEPTTCDLFSCASRTVVPSAVGRLDSARYSVQLLVGSPMQAQRARGLRYSAVIGAGAYTSEP